MDGGREHGTMTMIHAENADCIAWLTEKLLTHGRTAPKFKAAAHVPPEKREATHRAITLAELAGVPVLIVHVASGEAAEQIRWAQRRGLRVYGETCPQYLFLTEADIAKPGMEGAKCICAPPPGSPENRKALWAALETDAFQVFSSDHAPFRYDDPKGKLVRGPNPPFNEITNGLPGIEARMPMLFSGAAGTGRMDIHRFVALTSTNAAKIYGLYPRKGTIAIGSDADLALWEGHHERGRPPRRDGLHALRRCQDHRLAGDHRAARRGDLSRVRFSRHGRGRALPALRGSEPGVVVEAARRRRGFGRSDRDGEHEPAVSSIALAKADGEGHAGRAAPQPVVRRSLPIEGDDAFVCMAGEASPQTDKASGTIMGPGSAGGMPALPGS